MMFACMLVACAAVYFGARHVSDTYSAGWLASAVALSAMIIIEKVMQ